MDKETVKQLEETKSKTKDANIKAVIDKKLEYVNKPITKK